MKNTFVACVFGSRPLVAIFNKEATAYNWAKSAVECGNYIVEEMPKQWANAIIKMVYNGIRDLEIGYKEDEKWCSLSDKEREATANLAFMFWENGERALDYAQFLMKNKEGREAWFF